MGRSGGGSGLRAPANVMSVRLCPSCQPLTMKPAGCKPCGPPVPMCAAHKHKQPPPSCRNELRTLSRVQGMGLLCPPGSHLAAGGAEVGLGFRVWGCCVSLDPTWLREVLRWG